ALFEKQVTSFYPDVVIDEVEDYNIFTESSVASAQVLLPAKNYRSVFRTYQQLKSDPLSTITNAFSKLSVTEGAAVQFVVRPAPNGWQKKLEQEAGNIINPKKKGRSLFNPLTWVSAIFDLFTSGDATIQFDEDKSTGERVSQMA